MRTKNSWKIIKTKSDFLTVCAYCKRYRDKSGKWKSMKVITDEPKKEITHGLCPDCVKKHFPKFAGNH